MNWFAKGQFYARALFLKRKLEAQLTEEVRTHVEMATEANVARGMSPDEARYAALREFGNVASIQEQAREGRGWVWLEQSIQDVRFAVRQLRRSPSFAFVSVLSLGLAIGSNTAIFSLYHEVLLKPLPVPKPAELVLFRWTAPVAGFKHMHPVSGWSDPAPGTDLQRSTSFSLLSFEWFRDNNAVFQNVIGFAPLNEVKVGVNGVIEISPTGQMISGGYFQGLGIQPALGRLLSEEDDRTGAAAVAVISDRYWQRRFGRDPSIIGQGIEINGVPCTIIGVTPPEFYGTLQVGEAPDVFVPLAHVAEFWPQIAFFMKQPWRFWFVQVMGRLRPEVSRAQAGVSLEELFRRSAIDDQASGPVPGPAEVQAVDAPRLELLPGERGLFHQRRIYAQPLGLLQCSAAMVLLVACINIANLLLARGAARRREFATRIALGAGRGRIARQVMIESAVIAAGGTLVGLALAWWGKDLLLTMRALGAESQNLVLHPRLDLPVLGFTAGVALLTTLLFGLVPALHAARSDLRTGVAGRTLGPGRPTLRFERGLMVAQVSLSLMVLVGAGLLIRTLHNLRQIELGFNPEQLVMFRLDASGTDRSPAQLLALYDDVAEQVRGIPAVQAVSYSSVPVLTDARDSTILTIEGDSAPLPRSVSPMMNVVTGDFFGTLQMHRLAGRTFGNRDAPDSPPTAVINNTLARQLFGAASPLARRVMRQGRPTEIVGVVNDASYADVREPMPPTIYFAFTQNPPNPQGGPGAGVANFVVRIGGPIEPLAQSIRSLIRAKYPGFPLIDLRTQAQQIDRQLGQQQLLARLSGSFGGIVLALVAIGLYGLISYAVLRRSSEIGIRMALGAAPGMVLQMILLESLRLVLWGVALGCCGALATGRYLASRLYGVTPTDPLAYGAVALLMVVISIFASWLPARRAAKVDPVVALRAE